jgi:hypothetical protein
MQVHCGMTKIKKGNIKKSLQISDLQAFETQ